MATFCSNSFTNSFTATEELPADVRFGCELKHLNPSASSPAFDAEIDESLLLGSRFQVWEKCLSSVITKLHLADTDNPTTDSLAI
ncbi:hypothetical protein DSO57_1030367 [Entomophthora muscae]|uniref:Uncharacterized protein n=2 Tax=Entomophthora muscae TaxID=34485 RepID=A0ACC2SQ42_9FUNG|nr:hypothetical protein DSO57_1013975 [Entomophthora muscae]KAJ9064458.1 hypothetical protein DSO57_1030367 [Entomophthora muscae]